MRFKTLSVLAVAMAAVSLSACSSGNPTTTTNEAGQEVQTDVGRGYVDIKGFGRKLCIYDHDIHTVGYTSRELKGELAARLLTPEARKAGIRVTTAGTEVSGYGSQIIYYYAPDGNCLLWTESLTLQEFSVRVGLDPMGISPFYEPDVSQTPNVEEKK